MKISRVTTGLLAVALLAFLASDVMAQRGGGRPGGGQGGAGGPGGGPGGFGGGRGGGPGGFGGGRGGGDPTMGLLRIQEVKDEIELMPDQEEALTKLNEQRGERERPNVDFRSMGEEERNAFFEKMRVEREEATAKQREQLEEILLPEQVERLEQIALQQRGVGALMDEKIAKTLKITTAQTEELKTLSEGVREKMMSRMRELFQAGDRDAMRDEISKIRKENDEEMLSVLTADQKKQYEEMKGKPFEMPESEQRGFGGRGGQGGGPGGGGRGGFGGRGGQDGGGNRGGGERRRPAIEE